MISNLLKMLSYPFMQRALVVGILVSLCAALLGVSLVLKRYSMIGDGLSHVGFGSLAIAAALGFAPLAFTIPVVVLAAFLLLRMNESSKIKGDAAVAMLSVGALAVGYLLMNLFTPSSNLSGDVCSTLFGSTSILTLTLREVWLCAGLSLVVVVLFVLLYHKVFAVTFDESFSTATGTSASPGSAASTAVVSASSAASRANTYFIFLIGLPPLSFPCFCMFRAASSFFAAAYSVCLSRRKRTAKNLSSVSIDCFTFSVFTMVSFRFSLMPAKIFSS